MPDVIAGIGCTTRDNIITASSADLDAFLRTQRPAHPVQFALTDEERDAYRRFGAKHGQHAWTPGGTVSNTLCAAAAVRIEQRLPLGTVAWRGPAEYDDSIVSDVGLAHMRAWGIDLQPDYRTGFAREAYCLVDDASGEVHRIAIYERNARIAGQPHWTPCALLIMTLHDLLNGDAALFDYVARCRDLALLVADWRGAPLRTHLGAFANLRYVIGQRRDFVELELCDGDAREFDAGVEHVECVGTDGPRPIVWKGAGTRTAVQWELDATDAASHLLGAGDGYAGAFLASRAAGLDAPEAHAIALARARRVMRSATSHAPRGEDLNEIFPPHIDRRSASGSEASFATRLHASPGLVVTSCGQTGIDQLAIQTARGVFAPA
ncbi:MAG TPA: carbohydrate kinase family protein, partial [Thermoanaerobaculia bacterium]|nr:carbohydrate kinase family protein [Thermoanaerobaculia bacterium]